MKFCRSCGTSLAGTTPGSPAMAPLLSPVGGAPGMGPPPGMMPGRPMSMPMPQPLAAPLPVTIPPTIPPGPAPMPMPLPMAPTPISAPRAVPQGSSITCPRCGTSTPLGFAFCQQCGLHIQPMQPTDPAGSRVRPPSVPPPQAVRAPSAPPVPIDPQGATLAAPDTPRAAALGAVAPPVVRIAGAAWGSAVLVNRDGSDGQRFQLASEDTVFGRAGADIAFDDDRFLARQHARLERAADGSVKIHAIDTLNGVFKKADSPVELADGATLLVGREVLRFEKLAPEERTVHPLVRHGVALFGSPPRDPWGRLVQLVPSGGYRDVRHLAGEEIVLGREEGDIVFRDDAFMSRRHAAVTWNGQRAQVTDLGSSNGTFVRIAGPTPLKHGDHVRMGDQLLRIELTR